MVTSLPVFLAGRLLHADKLAMKTSPHHLCNPLGFHAKNVKVFVIAVW